MAKGLRASVKKSNRQKLRSNVFAPVEDARTQRLHEKLLETIRQAKPEPPQKQDMDVDSNHEANPENEYPKEMDVDGPPSASSAPSSSLASSNKKKINRSKLKRKQKPRNQITFPKSSGKGALKPFSNSRVRKRGI